MRDRLVKMLEKAEEKAEAYLRENDHMDYIPTLKEILGVYADSLLESGVIVPPCKVGDTVYILVTSQNYIDESKVIGIIIGRDNDTLQFKDGSIYTIWSKAYDKHFGKTVFLTREEAEAALAERSKG